MTTEDELRAQFDEMAIEVSDEVLTASVEACHRWQIDDAEEFVERWMSYSLSNLNGADPTVAYILEMEANELAPRARKLAASSVAIGGSTPKVVRRSDGIRKNESRSLGGSTGGGGLIIYSNADGLDEIENDVLGSYGCKTPKNTNRHVSRLQRSAGQLTPDGGALRNRGGQFSPASYSPITSALKKTGLADSEDSLQGSTGAGNVVYTFGRPQLLKQTSWSRSPDPGKPLAIQIGAGEPFLTEDCKFMYDSTHERVLTLGERIYEQGQAICARLAAIGDISCTQGGGGNAEEEEHKISSDDREASVLSGLPVYHANFPSNDPIRVLGRIVVFPEQRTDPHQKPSQLGLVDFDEMALRYTALNFARLANQSWAVHPGQTVLLEGVNPRGNYFEVRRIHSERTLQAPRPPRTLERALNVVVAAGPFTTAADDLCYDRLYDLVGTYCTEHIPDLLILLGPFAPATNPAFAELATPFADCFNELLTSFLTLVPSTTQVLLVSHHTDVASSFVFPTHPLRGSSTFRNIHFLPDPCVVSVEGVELALTSIDVVKDLSEAEIADGVAGGGTYADKVKRTFNYMMHAQSFYPLQPPPDSLPLDLDLLREFGRLPRVPNVMITPSELKCFVRDINGCVCLNPGRLVDHRKQADTSSAPPASGVTAASSGGTFARLVIHPAESETAIPFDYVACQVVKS